MVISNFNTMKDVLDFLSSYFLGDEKNIDWKISMLSDFQNNEHRVSYSEIVRYLERQDDIVKAGEKANVMLDSLDQIKALVKGKIICQHKHSSIYICDFSGKSLERCQDHKVCMELGQYEYHCFQLKNLLIFLEQMYDYIDLESIRLNREDKQQKIMNAKIDEMKNQVDINQEILKSSEDTLGKNKELLDETEKKLNHVYMNIIAIVGIFTAIIVGVFGAMGVMSSVTEAFVVGDITLFRVILVTFVLILFVFWTFMAFIIFTFKKYKEKIVNLNAAALVGVVTLSCIGMIIWSALVLMPK